MSAWIFGVVTKPLMDTLPDGTQVPHSPSLAEIVVIGVLFYITVRLCLREELRSHGKESARQRAVQKFIWDADRARKPPRSIDK